jgi:hypothetical protein
MMSVYREGKHLICIKILQIIVILLPWNTRKGPPMTGSYNVFPLSATDDGLPQLGQWALFSTNVESGTEESMSQSCVVA